MDAEFTLVKGEQCHRLAYESCDRKESLGGGAGKKAYSFRVAPRRKMGIWGDSGRLKGKGKIFWYWVTPSGIRRLTTREIGGRLGGTLEATVYEKKCRKKTR